VSIFRKSDESKPNPPGPPGAAAAPASRPSPAATAPGSACVIGSKTRIKGELTGDEDVVVEGLVEGQIRIARDLHVGPGGTVKANVDARSVLISGELTGDCHASGRVEIQASGRMVGNVRAPRLAMAEGAVFRGRSEMSSEIRGETGKKAAAS